MFRFSVIQSRPWLAAAGVTAAAAALGGCGVSPQSARLGAEPQLLEVEMVPAVLQVGESAALVVRSPGADSISFESENGLDRYWSHGPELRAVITSDFGEQVPAARYAAERDGRVLDLLTKPARIAICRQGRCTEHYHEVRVRLPEHNRRSVALSGGWSSVFARRSILGGGRTVLLREALTSGVWTLGGEVAAGRWNARVRGFAGGDEHGASFDVSRMLLGGDGLSYGLSMHADATHSGWLAAGISSAPGRTAYRVGIGPSVMLKGVTASSLLGLYTDGTETLQISSTRISVNGNLTPVRHPVTITAEKSFAFGGGAIVSRRRDALDRLTAAVRVLDDLALHLGVSSHRLTWPEANPADDLRASETVITLGAQYSVTW